MSAPDTSQSYLSRAISFAEEAHRGQTRKKSGLPYITHPLRVMTMVAATRQLDSGAIAAAVLHDVVEDTPVTLEQIHEEFGPGCAHLVDLLTKKKGQDPREYLRLIAGNRDAVILKLCDRIDNLTDAFHLDDDFIKKYLRKTVPIQMMANDWAFAPTVNSLQRQLGRITMHLQEVRLGRPA